MFGEFTAVLPFSQTVVVLIVCKWELCNVLMKEICLPRVFLWQVMVFVHARNATVRTAMGLIEMAKNRGEICFFQPDQGPDYGHCEKQVKAKPTFTV